MMLSRWTPFRTVRFDHEDFFNHLACCEEPELLRPAVDIREEAEHYVLVADLPGLQEKDITVKVHDHTLTLSGKREETREEGKQGTYYRERRFGSFERTFHLGQQVDPERIEARYRNGELTVMLPKSERAKPREIPVAVS